jgi:peptide/nickel transport system substrate-binding protein
MRKLNVLGAAALALALCTQAIPATAQKAVDTLRIVFRDAVPNIDPYYNSQRTGRIRWCTAIPRPST